MFSFRVIHYGENSACVKHIGCKVQERIHEGSEKKNTCEQGLRGRYLFFSHCNHSIVVDFSFAVEVGNSVPNHGYSVFSIFVC